jgi:hypothetical protein
VILKIQDRQTEHGFVPTENNISVVRGVEKVQGREWKKGEKVGIGRKLSKFDKSNETLLCPCIPLPFRKKCGTL